LDLITTNEQLKQIIRFSKFLPWKIWRNFIIASGGAFNKGNWNFFLILKDPCIVV